MQSRLQPIAILGFALAEALAHYRHRARLRSQAIAPKFPTEARGSAMTLNNLAAGEEPNPWFRISPRSSWC